MRKRSKMPNGRTHREVHDKLFPAVVAGVAVTSISLFLGGDATLENMACIWMIPMGFFLGNWLDPDLDLVVKTRLRGWKKLNPYYIWRRGYTAFAKLMGGHRATMTHIPFVSTALRFVWFLLPVLIGSFYIGLLSVVLQEISLSVLLGVYLGLSISDSIHTGLDIACSLL
jgi:uncharacterized metal-binding protein